MVPTSLPTRHPPFPVVSAASYAPRAGKPHRLVRKRCGVALSPYDGFEDMIAGSYVKAVRGTLPVLDRRAVRSAARNASVEHKNIPLVGRHVELERIVRRGKCDAELGVCRRGVGAAGERKPRGGINGGGRRDSDVARRWRAVGRNAVCEGHTERADNCSCKTCSHDV